MYVISLNYLYNALLKNKLKSRLFSCNKVFILIGRPETRDTVHIYKIYKTIQGNNNSIFQIESSLFSAAAIREQFAARSQTILTINQRQPEAITSHNWIPSMLP
jgi:hypothetical protein